LDKRLRSVRSMCPLGVAREFALAAAASSRGSFRRTCSRDKRSASFDWLARIVASRSSFGRAAVRHSPFDARAPRGVARCSPACHVPSSLPYLRFWSLPTWAFLPPAFPSTLICSRVAARMTSPDHAGARFLVGRRRAPSQCEINTPERIRSPCAIHTPGAATDWHVHRSPSGHRAFTYLHLE